MMLIWLLLFGLVIYLLFNHPNYTISHQNVNQNSDPLEIAKIRLAKGDITIEEYENVKKVILNIK
ncbi:MAG: SHOCT domain-containing protein [Bacillota bacterium]|nr:SHOCT domain-containing protein [Bacillota bacterium]